MMKFSDLLPVLFLNSEVEIVVIGNSSLRFCGQLNNLEYGDLIIMQRLMVNHIRIAKDERLRIELRAQSGCWEFIPDKGVLNEI